MRDWETLPECLFIRDEDVDVLDFGVGEAFEQCERDRIALPGPAANNDGQGKVHKRRHERNNPARHGRQDQSDGGRIIQAYTPDENNVHSRRRGRGHRE